MSHLLKITKVRGTPVFTTSGTDMRLSKVYGSMYISNLWYFPAFYPVYRIVLKDFRALKLNIELSETAKTAVAQLDEYDEKIRMQTLPSDFRFKTKPYAHQLEGLIHLIYNYRAALFYACGLGKTKCVIDWQRAVKCYPLILCPRIVISVWNHELIRHGIDQEYAVIDAASKAEKLSQISDAKNYSGAIISYDSARIYYKEVATTIPYNAIVADESHYIKGYKSRRSKAAVELGKKACRRIIMSGTPSLGDPRDMYMQLQFLAPAFASEPFWKFKEMFCNTSPHNKRIVIGFKNLDLLHERVSLIAHRRTKTDCLDLPERTEQDIVVPLERTQRRIYNSLLFSQEFDELADALLREENLLSSEGVLEISNAAILINKLLQVSCGFVYKKPDLENICDSCEHVRTCVVEEIRPYTKKCLVCQKAPEPLIEELKKPAKIEALITKLEDILSEPEHKCIVWGQYIPELNLLEREIEVSIKKIRPEWFIQRVDGRTRDPGKAAEVFNTNPNCKVYLGQVATGVGITLNAANYMIYHSLPWKMGDYDQSKDRNYRVGQQRNVTIYRLLGKETIDLAIARALSMKQTVAETIITTIVCSRCSRKKSCRAESISLYEEGCKYKRAVDRPITRARPI